MCIPLTESCCGKYNLVLMVCKRYRAVAIMSRKHVTRHFRVAKKYCAQWQLKGSRCLTHNLCAIFIGFTRHDNCTIAIVNIIKAKVPSCSRFWVHCTTDHSFATQTWKITEITKNKQRDVQLIYGRDVTCNCSVAARWCGHGSKVVFGWSLSLGSPSDDFVQYS